MVTKCYYSVLFSDHVASGTHPRRRPTKRMITLITCDPAWTGTHRVIVAGFFPWAALHLPIDASGFSG